MELEELKQQWEMLYEKLNEQEIINKKLLENAVAQKIDFISGYNWLGVLIGIIALPVTILVNTERNLDKELLFAAIGMLVFFIAWGIYKALHFQKVKSFKNDILSTENNILKYQQHSFWYYLISLIIVFGFLTLALVLYYDRLIAYNRLWFFVTFIVLCTFAGVREMKWYLGKLQKLRQSIIDFKEFEKE